MVALVCVFQDTRTQDYFISGFQMAEIIYIVDLSIFWKHVMLLADVMLLMLQTSTYDFCHEEQNCCVFLSFKLHNMIFVREIHSMPSCKLQNMTFALTSDYVADALQMSS